MEGRDMADLELPDGLRDDLRAAWHRYIDLLAPLRPALHGYCCRLTGNLWDAEDLVQDTLLRAFGTLGSIFTRIENPRPSVLRPATNLWIDTVRGRGNEATALAEQAPLATSIDAEAAGAVRDAGTVLLQRLAPQERAAVVLKELFDYRLEEIAEVLATTVGAVKAALHRGRTRLREPEGEAASQRPVPSVALVDRFVAAYAAADVPGRIVRLRGYAFCPETMRAIGAELDLKVRTGLYRFPTPEPGKLWADVTPATTEGERR